jgi:acyl-CoA dehydrogenase
MQRTLFNEDHNIFREQYRKFLKKEVEPYTEEWREAGIVPREMFKKMGDLGFLLTWADEKFGGLGNKDFRYQQIMQEEDATYSDAGFYHTLHSRLVGPYINNFGSEEQRRYFLPDCISGGKILAVAMTEPDAGSDLGGMKTKAEYKGDYWELNGSKTYISNGINSDLVITAAKTNPDNDREIGLFIIERGMEGFERGRNLKKMGLKAQDTAELFFNNVKVPIKNVLGDPRKGFHYLMQGLAEERLLCAVGFLAAGRRAFDITTEYVSQRKAFGKQLSAFQNTRFQLASICAELEMAQIYIDHCVAMHCAEKLTSDMAAKAKLIASELECRMTDLGVQLHGGAGYMEEYEICRLFTNARISRIYGGTSEIMKEIIARNIFE